MAPTARRLGDAALPHSLIFVLPLRTTLTLVLCTQLILDTQTHLRNMPILPEMVGAVVGVFSGKGFPVVEIKPEMIGKYLAEFSITYKPTLHGRPGLGATHSSRFIPLK